MEGNTSATRQKAADSLGRTRQERVDAIRTEAQHLKELPRAVQAGPSKPAEQFCKQ